MKRLSLRSLSLILVILQFIFVLPVFAGPATAVNIAEFPEYDLTDPALPDAQRLPALEFEPPGEKWQKLVADEAPVGFSQVYYELADDVIDITDAPDVTQSIASEGQLLAKSSIQKQKPADLIQNGARISRDVLNRAAQFKGRKIESGSVVADFKSQTAFRVAASTEKSGLFQTNSQLEDIGAAIDDTYSISSVQLSDIFQDLEVGGAEGETIKLNRANITGFAPGVEESLVLPGSVPEAVGLYDDYDGFKYLRGDLLVNLHFKDKLINGSTSSGTQVQVKLRGGIGVEEIQSTLKYTCCKGYFFELRTTQECYLAAELSATVDEEVRILLFGVDAPVKDIGRVSGGLFLIIGLDGKFTLELAVREHAMVGFGARGKTAGYVPLTVKPFVTSSYGAEGDTAFSGAINGYAKLGPLVDLQFFGFTVIGAGLLLGVGVNMKVDPGSSMSSYNVLFYASLEIYLDILNKRINLANWTKPIWQKKRSNTMGYSITFEEVYINPGRVSGILEKEKQLEDASSIKVPASGLPYRVLVIPWMDSFLYEYGDKRGIDAVKDPAVRRYPKSGYATTNEYGVFFQNEDVFLQSGDKVLLEVKLDQGSIFSELTEPSMPFDRISIERADGYNQFLTGQIEPIRLINPAIDPKDTDKRYEYFYCANKLIEVDTGTHHRYYADDSIEDTWFYRNGTAYTRTDEEGRFDTRLPAYDEKGQVKLALSCYNQDGSVSLDNEYCGIHFILDNAGHTGKRLNADDFAGCKIYVDTDDVFLRPDLIGLYPSVDLHFTRYIQEVPDSKTRFTLADGRIVDQMAYDEYIFIDNIFGNKPVDPMEFCYFAQPFSTQGIQFPIDPRFMSDKLLEEASKKTSPLYHNAPAKKMITLLDEQGQPNGTSLFLQRVIVEYVWQNHPNPLQITSPDHFTSQAGPDIFQITAKGYAPFAFSLADAAPGINVDRDSGLISVDPATAPGEYSFIIKAEENRQAYQTTLPNGLVLDYSKVSGPYQGNDPSEPAEQLFTLKLLEAEPTPTPEPTATPTPTLVPTPNPLKLPVIEAPSHKFKFNMTEGEGNRQLDIMAVGSKPFSWSIQPHPSLPMPAGCKVDKSSGRLTLSSQSGAGKYGFTIVVANEAGQDSHICSLDIDPPTGPPVIEDPFKLANPPELGFVFFKRGQDQAAQLTARGSQPISWSLDLRDEYPFPEGIYINEETGELTFDKDMSLGDHYFAVRATNVYGSDTRPCKLTVRRLIGLSGWEEQSADINLAHTGTGLSTPGAPGAVFTANGSNPLAIIVAEEDDLLEALDTLIGQSGPPNTITLRYDNPKDAYRAVKPEENGAAYVKWVACPGITLVYEKYPHKRWARWVGEIFRDAVPLADAFQYGDKDTDKELIQEINDYFRDKLKEYEEKEVDLDKLGGIFFPDKEIMLPPQMIEINKMLDYGDILEKMKKKGSKTKVELDDSTGTSIPGQVLDALEDNPSAGLDIIQEGLEVSFSGEDMDGGHKGNSVDLGYWSGEEAADQIKDASGTDDLFAYDFSEHGKLPGRATFTIETDREPGSTVNVYQQVEDGLALVASNLKVGSKGEVRYLHDVLGLFAITGQDLPVKRTLPSADWQDFPDGRSYPWPFVAGALAGLVLVGLVIWLFVRRSRKKAKLATD